MLSRSPALLRRSFATSKLTKQTLSSADLLSILRRNTELSEEEARIELRWIRSELRSINPKRQSDDQVNVDQLVRRRGAGEPLQYVLGSTDFGPMSLHCRPPVLIPRPETAFIFERYATLIKEGLSDRESTPDGRNKLKVLDLCTGSGCIPLLLSHLLPEIVETPVGVDISISAIALAKENGKALEIPLELLQADLFDLTFTSRMARLVPQLDVLVSNPPYISSMEFRGLAKGVREWEDPGALLDNPSEEGDGLRFYRRLAELIPRLLALDAGAWAEKVPRVLLEIGHQQASAVTSILIGNTEGRVTKTEVWKDQYDRDRAIAAWVS